MRRISRPLRYNDLPYHGLNLLMLWSESLEKGFASPYWMTFRQAALLNAHVRKVEHGTSIVYTDKIIRKVTDEHTGGTTTERAIPFIKSYYVYNAGQMEGLSGLRQARAAS